MLVLCCNRVRRWGENADLGLEMSVHLLRLQSLWIQRLETRNSNFAVVSFSGQFDTNLESPGRRGRNSIEDLPLSDWPMMHFLIC